MSSLLLSPALQRAQSDGSDGSDNDREAEALATAAAAAFLLTDDEVAQMSAAILTARMASWKATYTAAAKTAGAALPDGGAAPSAAEERKQQRESDEAAASIAATYARDLASRAATFTQDWLKQHDGSLDGAADALRHDLATFSEQRADWKGGQVASYETGVGGNDGTSAAINDLQSGDLTRINGLPFSASNLSSLYVAVLPESSSLDYCSDYAGNVYPFDADLPDFPTHVGCVHYITCIPYSEVDDLADGPNDASDALGDTEASSTQDSRFDPLAGDSAVKPDFRSTGEKQAVRDFASEHANDSKETLRILGKDGKILYEETGGSLETGANMTEEDRRLQIGNSSVHNHPDNPPYGPGISFSVADVQTAVENEMDAIYVVAPDGESGSVLFSLKQTAAGSWTRDAWARDLAPLYTEAAYDATETVDEAGLTGFARRRAIRHLSWQNFADAANKKLGQDAFAYSWQSLSD